MLSCEDKKEKWLCETLKSRGHCERFEDIRNGLCKRTCGTCKPEREESRDEDEYNNEEETDDTDDGERLNLSDGDISFIKMLDSIRV